MIPKPFDQIEKSDIDLLISNQVRENSTIEYKQSVPLNTRDGKKEFLADISSFANSMGGDILYGIIEKVEDGRKTGIPETAKGLKIASVDEQTRILDQIIRSGLDPKLNVQIRDIGGFPEGPVLVIRIPKSWAAPHMLTTGESRFYARNNAGKQPLDVREIRSAFAISESLPEKIRRFRDDRLSRIISNDTPILLEDSPKTVLHILPISALDPTISLSPEQMQSSGLRTIYYSYRDSRFNLDGYLTYRSDDNSGMAYVQLFRNAAIESVETGLLRDYGDYKKFIASVAFEEEIIKALTCYLNSLKSLDVATPIFVLISLLGVKNYRMYIGGHWNPYSSPVDRDTLLLPDILVDDYNIPVPTILRPAFDALWQAAGCARSLNYDKQGIWHTK